MGKHRGGTTRHGGSPGVSKLHEAKAMISKARVARHRTESLGEEPLEQQEQGARPQGASMQWKVSRGSSWALPWMALPGGVAGGVIPGDDQAPRWQSLCCQGLGDLT
jgi:hypothetical protein